MTRTKDDCALDDVRQLPHVAGPGVGLEPRERGRRDRGEAPLRLPGEPIEEVAREVGDVLLPLAQRRQRHRDHVEPVIEVLAELTLLHGRVQLAVRRGDDAHVDGDRLRPAHALEGALLEEPQQLRLQLVRDVADLVEQHGPAVRRRKLGAELRTLRTGAGLTSGEAARLAGWHQSKVSRIETGASGVKPADVRLLLDVYGVRDAQLRELLLVKLLQE